MIVLNAEDRSGKRWAILTPDNTYIVYETEEEARKAIATRGGRLKVRTFTLSDWEDAD